MPEQPVISIKAAIAPQVAGGLHSLVEKALTAAAAEKQQKADRGGRTTIINRSEGTVRGTLFQIGKVEGDVHHHGDR